MPLGQVALGRYRIEKVFELPIDCSKPDTCRGNRIETPALDGLWSDEGKPEVAWGLGVLERRQCAGPDSIITTASVRSARALEPVAALQKQPLLLRREVLEAVDKPSTRGY